MMVPTPRLLAVWAAVGLPLAAAAGLAPAARPAALALLAGAATLMAVDAWAGRRRVRGVGVELEPVVRLTRGRAGQLRTRVFLPARSGSRELRLALVGVESLERQPEELALRAPTGTGSLVVDWPVLPGERGRERITQARIEVVSPAGLWAARAAVPVDCEVRIYPELGEAARSVVARLWRRGAAGAHLAPQLGRGREFDRLREYVAGDPLDEIHWKATARRGRPVSKVFRVERTQEVYVALDRSRLSGRLVDGRPALEATLQTALVLGIACRRFGDLFGVVSFADRVDRFVRAGAGRGHFNACRDALFDGRSHPVAPDFGELATFLRSRLRRRALVVVLTDLEDGAHADQFVRTMRIVAERHLVLALGLRPAGVEPLFARRAHDTRAVYERLAGHRRWRRLEELRRALSRRGIGFHLVAAPELVVEAVGRYVDVKARQQL